jgi:major outer membrane protein
MKKLVVTLLMTLTCRGIQALPLGNPGEATLFTNGIYCESGDSRDPCDPCFSLCDIWSVRAGFYGNYVYNRYLEATNHGKEVKKTTIFTNAGYLALNFFDRVDLFGTLGATNITLTLDNRITGLTPPLIVAFPGLDVIKLQSAFSWSVGGRATLLECNCFTVGIEGEYFRTAPHFHNYKSFSQFTESIDDFKTTYSEWQVGLGAAYRVEICSPSLALVPYMGITWSNCTLAYTQLAPFILVNVIAPAIPVAVPKLQNNKSFGYAVGTSLTLCNLVGVTVEGRFGDEKAFYVNGQLRF